MADKNTRFYSRLEKQQLDKVKKEAKKQKISWAEVIRRLIDKYL